MAIAALTQEVGACVSVHIEYSLKEQTEMTVGVLPTFYFLISMSPQLILTTFRVSPPFTDDSLSKRPYKYTEACTQLYSSL